MSEKQILDKLYLNKKSVAPEVSVAMENKPNRKRRIELAPVNELIKKPFLNEFEVAAITGRAVSTYRNERHMRKGLPYHKISARSIRYKTSDVIAFMEGRRITFDEVQ